MPTPVRLILLVIVLLGVGWFIFEVTSGDVPDVPDVDPAALVGGGAVASGPRVFTSSSQCAECHAEIYDEWKSSYHGQAWTDEEYQLLRTQENSQDCIPCHAPKPAFETGIGNRFLARYDRRGEGVDCFTCHKTDKGMIGPIPDPDPAPCNPVFDLNIRKMDLCYPCHNQHDTHIEWEASSFFKDGKDCNSCHMPAVERPVATGGKVRLGSSHSFRGGHDHDYIRSNVDLEVTLLGDAEMPAVFQGPYGVDLVDPHLLGAKRDEDDDQEPPAVPSGAPKLVVRVRNHGVGHNFPTDSRNNTVDLKVVVLNQEGQEVERIHVDRFRNPYRDEYKKNKVNTQLPSGADRFYVVQLPIKSGSFQGHLIYKSGPFLQDDDENSFVLINREGEF